VGLFVSGVTDFRFDGPFLSDFSIFGGADSFTAGSLTAGSLTGGASVFGAIVPLGFTSAGAFLSDFGFLPGGCDSSGVGCWAITAPASASEQTVIKVVNFFMLFLFGRKRRRSIQPRPFFAAQSIDRLAVIIRASLPIWPCHPRLHAKALAAVEAPRLPDEGRSCALPLLSS
jgi:hypothetical protein